MQGLFNLYLSLLFCLLRVPSPSLSPSLCFRVESASRRHVRCIFGPLFPFPLCMCLTKVTYCDSACFLFFFRSLPRSFSFAFIIIWFCFYVYTDAVFVYPVFFYDLFDSPSSFGLHDFTVSKCLYSIFFFCG
jgi:hypothetical protein